MMSRSTASFFADLGIVQTFSRPRTPTDNAACESWVATLKCERLYEADTAELTPDQVESMIDRFIHYYNEERLHRPVLFVTPADRHKGRHVAIIAARKEGMRKARVQSKMAAYGGTGEVRCAWTFFHRFRSKDQARSRAWSCFGSVDGLTFTHDPVDHGFVTIHTGESHPSSLLLPIVP